MKRINEIFYSLQGEGRNTGRAAVFIRLAGCNLRCPFCDTDFNRYTEMTDDDILRSLAPYPSRFVVITGGEPSLQLDELLVEKLHAHGYEIAVETNGTHPLPEAIDWVTISPKAAFTGEPGRPLLRRCNELKCVFDGLHEVDDYGIQADYFYLQPCDTGDPQRNSKIAQACMDYIKQHPRWRLSLQTHKLVGFR